MFNDAAYWAADILVNYSRFPPLLRYPAAPHFPIPCQIARQYPLIFMLVYMCVHGMTLVKRMS